MNKITFLTGAKKNPYLNIGVEHFLGYTGMRHRMHLGEEEGVLFKMDKEDDHVFWMKDVYLPLDIIFISRNKVVVGTVQYAVPGGEIPLSCGELSWDVIETRAGFCKKNNIKKGTKVEYDFPTKVRF